jgi:hypothetical protein
MLKKVVLIKRCKKGLRVLLHKKGCLKKLFCLINAKEKELKAMLYNTYLYQTFDVTNH